MPPVRSFNHETIQLSSGGILEATLILPPSYDRQTEAKLAICLHPWTWLGGRMDDPVLYALEEPLQRKGYLILRYNSRGVGKSSGWRSLTGAGEAQDLQHVVQWALGAIPSLASVVIVGYSHGSLIASLYPVSSGPIKTSHILLSYPLGPRNWLTAFHSNMYTTALRTLLHDPGSNTFVIYGDHDEFTGADSYDEWVSNLRAEVEGPTKGRLSVARIDGGTHFWRGNAGEKMLEVVAEWLS